MESRLFSEASSLADAGARAAKGSKGVAASSNGEKTRRSKDMQQNKYGSLRLEPSQTTALIQKPDAAARKPKSARFINDASTLLCPLPTGELCQHFVTLLGLCVPCLCCGGLMTSQLVPDPLLNRLLGKAIGPGILFVYAAGSSFLGLDLQFSSGC